MVWSYKMIPQTSSWRIRFWSSSKTTKSRSSTSIRKLSVKSCASSSLDSRIALRSMATTRTYRSSSCSNRYLARSTFRILSRCRQRRGRARMPKSHKCYLTMRLIWNTIGWFTSCPFLSSRIRRSNSKSTKPSSPLTSWHHATVCTRPTKYASSSATKKTRNTKSAKT